MKGAFSIIKNKKRVFLLIVLFVFILFMIWRFVRPMNIFVVEEHFERPMKVEIPEGLNSLSASECGECHREIYKEWSESMHSKAWTDPYFQVDYRFDGSQQVCLNCHIPLENQQENLVLGFEDRAKLNPILQKNPNYDVELQQEGVTCVVCHVKEGKIVGPFETEDAPHPVMVDKEMTRGYKVCQKCHVVSGKRWDNFFGFAPCGTVAEIRKGGKEIDCIFCHMPPIVRPVVDWLGERKGGQHLFKGGHDPEMVKSALSVSYNKEVKNGKTKFIFRLTNTGADHTFPTGTPDRFLTLEFKLFNARGEQVGEEIYTMKRYIMWRPFIIEFADTRLVPDEAREFTFKIPNFSENPAILLRVVVKYHLLNESRRKRIAYQNKDPINYPIYQREISLL